MSSPAGICLTALFIVLLLGVGIPIFYILSKNIRDGSDARASNAPEDTQQNLKSAKLNLINYTSKTNYIETVKNGSSTKFNSTRTLVTNATFHNSSNLESLNHTPKDSSKQLRSEIHQHKEHAAVTLDSKHDTELLKKQLAVSDTQS